MIFINIILQTLHFVHVGKTKIFIIFSLHAIFFSSHEQFVKPTVMLDLANIDTNICGDVHLPLQININIFSAVQQFIEESIRFT